MYIGITDAERLEQLLATMEKQLTRLEEMEAKVTEMTASMHKQIEESRSIIELLA